MNPTPNNKEDRKEISEKLGINIDNGNVLAYQGKHGKGLIALVNYYKDTDVELHVLGHGKWATKKLFRHLFTHIFNPKLLNCKRCTVKISSKNSRSIKLVKRLGFVKEGELRGLDTNLYSLLREDCTWADYFQSQKSM